MAWLTACEPVGPLPGGELDGVPQPPPATWDEADEMEVVQLETRPDDPYSVNVWGVGMGEHYYVASGQGGDTAWVHHVRVNPDVRLRIGNEVYALRAVRVEDPEELARVRAHYLEKYEMDAEQQESADGAWIYRLDPRSPT